jgi:hypothetical protein
MPRYLGSSIGKTFTSRQTHYPYLLAYPGYRGRDHLALSKPIRAGTPTSKGWWHDHLDVALRQKYKRVKLEATKISVSLLAQQPPI